MNITNIVAKKPRYYSFLVSPVSNLDDALKNGHFNGCSFSVSAERVKLRATDGRKKVCVIPLTRKLEPDKILNHLASVGLKPCADAPNFLGGLMAAVQEADMPQELRDIQIVAAEPENPSSIFLNERGQKCFLCVHRHVLYRIPGLVGVEGDWSTRWALLGEKL
ncbi:MAG: hypothetical protein Q7S86_05610 [bacterium]|nr:hypothetical protein [bacterium]